MWWKRAKAIVGAQSTDAGAQSTDAGARSTGDAGDVARDAGAARDTPGVAAADPGEHGAGADSFGVGAQVVVRLNRAETSWPPQDDPVGVIIAPGFELATIYWAPPTADDPSWLIQFEKPFYGLDGSGPHASARVPERLLELAPLEPETSGVIA